MIDYFRKYNDVIDYFRKYNDMWLIIFGNIIRPLCLGIRNCEICLNLWEKIEIIRVQKIKRNLIDMW